MQIIHKNIYLHTICIDVQSSALVHLLVGNWIYEQLRHPLLFWLYLVSEQMKNWCPFSHLIIFHQGLVLYSTFSRLGATCLFLTSHATALHIHRVFLCLQSVLFIIVFIKFYTTRNRSSTVDRHRCWLTAGARCHARNINIANEHAFFLSVHFILVTVMLYRWAQIFLLLFLSTDNCEWKHTHGQRVI